MRNKYEKSFLFGFSGFDIQLVLGLNPNVYLWASLREEPIPYLLLHGMCLHDARHEKPKMLADCVLNPGNCSLAESHMVGF